MMPGLSGALDLLMDFVYPRACFLCQHRVEEDVFLDVCARCLQKLMWPQGCFCARCGLPLSGGSVACADCRTIPWSFQAVWSLGPYEGDLKKLIHALKFARDKGIGRDLAHFMLRDAALQKILSHVDLLIPVPMHPLKEKNRGYNQARILAEVLGESVGIPARADILLAARPSVPQTDLGRNLRWHNVAGTFVLNAPSAALQGLHVGLVDDVMTTGATAHHCGLVLQQAGTQSVVVIVAARSPVS